jgi:hypothetical protein
MFTLSYCSVPLPYNTNTRTSTMTVIIQDLAPTRRDVGIPLLTEIWSP